MKTSQVLSASALRAVASESDCYGMDMAVVVTPRENCHARAIAVYTRATITEQTELNSPEIKIGLQSILARIVMKARQESAKQAVFLLCCRTAKANASLLPWQLRRRLPR